MNQERLAIRIILDALMIGAVLFGPWWILLILGAFGVLVFGHFFEFIVFSIFVDALYGISSLSFIVTLLSLFIFVSISVFKKVLRHDTMTL